MSRLFTLASLSHPGLPSAPDSAQHIWIHGLVEQTVDLFLHRQARCWKGSADVVFLCPQGHSLHPWKSGVFLKAQFQLLTGRGKKTTQHKHYSSISNGLLRETDFEEPDVLACLFLMCYYLEFRLFKCDSYNSSAIMAILVLQILISFNHNEKS